jgi:hypothetical protein
MDPGRGADVSGDRTFRLRRVLGNSPSPSATAAGSGSAGGFGSSGGGSNARSGQASGGAVGTVASVSTPGFTMSTSAGQKVTGDETSSTTFQNDATSISASAITAGQDVLVLGTTSGTTITATQVTVQPTGGSGPAAGVIPFQPGAPTASKQVGQIPATTVKGRGRSSAERQRIRRRKLRWPLTRGASSTVLRS